MKKILLFDVDGTLTEPRKKIEYKTIKAIRRLKKVENVKIGIVGGSNLEKQLEQLGQEILNLFDYVFSENGLVSFKNNELINKTSIAEHLGENNIKILINTAMYYMSTIDIPVKRGNFIEFRNGMINLSPVGRSCSQEEREQFYEYDKIHKVRENMIVYLKDKLKNLHLAFSIGGQISIDVYPKGWDKTYCLKFIENDFDKIYFYGDRTMEGGNDYEIFSDSRTISHTVTGPVDTISKIDKFISDNRHDL
tara:strand:+ start:779 stop:1528 length:750 start_codon:yes stop_codon:yes gene_type:complete